MIYDSIVGILWTNLDVYLISFFMQRGLSKGILKVAKKAGVYISSF